MCILIKIYFLKAKTRALTTKGILMVHILSEPDKPLPLLPESKMKTLV